MAAMPKVIKNIVVRDSVIIQGGTRSRRLLTQTSSSPRISRGAQLSQNLLQSVEPRAIGAVCKIQNAFPSRLTAGKAKRTATALRTKPARARLAKETIRGMVPAGGGAAPSG